jgi:hypothetical protein
MAYVDFVEDFTQMQSDANRIIQKRVSMMLSGTMSGPEAAEMIGEKVIAMAESMMFGLTAVHSGNPVNVAEAMLRPYRRKTAHNVARLCS